MPRLTACGGRGQAFDRFKTAQANKAEGDYVAMLIDSEEPAANLEKTREHLQKYETSWQMPADAHDDQVLFMTTCTETWIVADRGALTLHYGQKLQDTALPPLEVLESRSRHDVQDQLAHATRNCSNSYQKGKRSFEVLAKLSPGTLEQHLPSFARARRILNEKLYCQPT
jgi:hypothetical protein